MKAQPFTNERGEHVCRRCRESLAGRHSTTVYCYRCIHAVAQDKGASAAHKEVAKAIAKGRLPRADTQTCVDCGGPARDWEHRDYGDPLRVEAVCRSCNKKRPIPRPALVLVG